MQVKSECNRPIDEHFQKQDALLTMGVEGWNLEKCNQLIEYQYYHISSRARDALKPDIKTRLLEKISKLQNGKKIAITLVDIQNDFVHEGFALGAPYSENTVVSNIAVLEAIEEIVKANSDYAKKIDIITSQDAHVYNRDINHVDSQIMAKSTYGLEATEKAIATEQQELQPINPAQGSFGFHCIIGTAGAAIAEPIEKRLTNLQDKFKIEVHRFGKINFSGPEAGMKLKSNVRLDDPALRNSNTGIYDENRITYLDHFKNPAYEDVYITGICGDVCVQQAALGLNKLDNLKGKIHLFDGAITYLGVPSYDQARLKYCKEYQKEGIEYIETAYWRSNPYAASLYGDLPIPTQIETDDFLATIHFQKHLSLLEAKLEQFEKERAESPAKKMEECICQLKNAVTTYGKAGLTKENQRAFVSQCRQAVAEAHSELRVHRRLPLVMDFLNLLINIANAMVQVLSFGYAPARSPDGFFSTIKTDSEQKLNAFYSEIQIGYNKTLDA